jgi:hypothetical protein
LAFHICVLDNKRHVCHADAFSKTQLIGKVAKEAVGYEIGICGTKNNNIKNVITYKKSDGGQD